VASERPSDVRQGFGEVVAGALRRFLAPKERGQQFAGNGSALARQIEQQRDLASPAGQLMQRPRFGLVGVAPISDLKREAAERAKEGARRAADRRRCR